MKMTRIAALSVLLAMVCALTWIALTPAPAAAEFCWTESRWVVVGCCGFSHTKLAQEERLCCQFTGCRSWGGTGATKCEGACW